MGQDTNGTIPQRANDQPVGAHLAPAVSIAALAAHYAYLIEDQDRNGDEMIAVEGMLLYREPESVDDLLSLTWAMVIELETQATNAEVCGDGNANVLRQLHRAAEALARGLVRHAGAKSPMDT
jgi:hypothetical protein